MKKKLSVIIALVLIMITAYSQETEKKETGKEEALKGTHRFTLVMGHSNLRAGIKENGKKGWKVVPSWGFDYDYWISDHWAIGLQADMMVETFEVEDHDNIVIERSRPIAIVAGGIFKPGEHVSFIAGMGGEFAEEGNYTLTRIGIETGWALKNNWEFGISLLYDIKWDAYDTVVLGFGISKLLKRSK